MTATARPQRPARMAELREYFHRRQPEMIATIRQLVEMESPSSNKSAVDQLGRVLAEKFKDIDGNVMFHRASQYGDHVQADFAGTAKAKPIMLLGHHDTVWDIGTLAKMPWRQESGRLWGPGVLDMKTGIVMMMYAIAGLKELRGALPCPVSVLLNTDEEVGSESSRPITEALAKKSAAVLVLEPAQGAAVKTARKGVGDYTIKVTGRASHSGVDFEKGQSAILELAHQVLAVARFTDLKRGMTVNPGVIRGGTRTNVVAAEASVDVDVRIARLADAPLLERKFRSLKPRNEHCKLEVSGGVNRPPMERSKGVMALYRQARELAGEIGWKLDEAATGGGSDGNFTAALGLPTLDGLGGVGEGAHALNESVLVDEIPRRTALLAGLIETIGL
jgi:glutamate carboxypeptidase